MEAKQYADALSARLSPEVFDPAPGRALWMPVHGAVVALCTTAIVDAQPPLLLSFGLSIVISISFTCLGILGHEILHGSVVERLWLRRLLGAICIAPIGIGAGFWSIWHNIHHANTQNPAKDPDNWGTLDHVPQDGAMGFLRRFAHPRTLMFPFLLLTGTTGHAVSLLFFLQKQLTGRQRVATLSEFLILWTFWFSLGFWLGWKNFLFFFVIPLLLANAIVNSIVVTNHFLSPLDDGSGDPLATSLTVTTYGWLERLLLNFNYHTEHHLFPRMSPKHAPAVARLLKETWPDRYQQLPYGRALLAVWRTPRLYHDRTRLVDTRNHTLYGALGHGLESPPANRSDAVSIPQG